MMMLNTCGGETGKLGGQSKSLSLIAGGSAMQSQKAGPGLSSHYGYSPCQVPANRGPPGIWIG